MKGLNVSPVGVAKVGFYGLLAYITWQAFQGTKGIIKGTTDTLGGVGASLGQAYADLTVPKVVNAQFKLKSSYFKSNGRLTKAAYDVISKHFPNFYRRAFDDRRIKPQYRDLVDSGQFIIDKDYQ